MPKTVEEAKRKELYEVIHSVLGQDYINLKFTKITIEENYEDPDAMYQLKYLMCVVMLLPTLWLNLRGNYCQKSESYKLIRKHFTEEDLEFLEACSSARFKWKKSYHVGNSIPEQVRKMLGSNYLTRAAKFAKLLESRLVS